MRRLLILIATAAAICACMHARARQADESSSHAIVRLIPADADAAIIVPHLKRSSDHITRLLEGMDRANLLVGSRPIDHFKSVTGFATAIDDEGAAAMVGFIDQQRLERNAWIVPVTNAAEFLQSNFTEVEEGEPNAHRSASGVIMYSRVIGSHIVLTEHDATLKAWDAPGNVAAIPDDFLQARTCDAAIMLKRDALDALALKTASQVRGLPGLGAIDFKRVAADCEALRLTIHCDPLALIVRSDWRFTNDSAAAANVAPNANEPRMIDALPAMPLALALTIDVQSIGGVRAMNGLLDGVAAPLPEWISDIDAIALGVGPNGKLGLLGDSAIIARTSQPASLRDAVLLQLVNGNRKITIAKPDPTAATETFALMPVSTEAWLTPQAMLEALAFGPSGAKGLLHVGENELVIAFAQRPALLNAFVAPAERVNDAAAVGIMRQWMPVHRDIEAYIGMAQMATLINTAAASLLQPEIALPSFDEHAPPVGFAADVTRQGVASSLILPSGVLAPLFDESLRRMRLVKDKDAEQP